MPKTISDQLETLDKIEDGETKILSGFIVRTAEGEFLDIDGDLGGFAPEYIVLHETYSDADNAAEDAAGETEDGFEYSVLSVNIVVAPATATQTGADIFAAAAAKIQG